jgi:hypothetical protein
MRRSLRALLPGLVTMLLLADCGPGPSTSTASAAPASPTVNLGARPASPAHLSIVSPTDGQVVHGSSLHVVTALAGASLTPNTTTRVDPKLGHIHLYVDNQLTYMNYQLSVDVPVKPGKQYAVYAEFVGEDHYPFNPRVVTPTLYVTVEP